MSPVVPKTAFSPILIVMTELELTTDPLVVKTTVGFGDVLVFGTAETWFAIVLVLVGMITNATVIGSLVALISRFITPDDGNRFIFAILAASASYIAVPAAMRLAAPNSDPGLYVPMALGLTFPLNITIGMPIYFAIVKAT